MTQSEATIGGFVVTVATNLVVVSYIFGKAKQKSDSTADALLPLIHALRDLIDENERRIDRIQQDIREVRLMVWKGKKYD